MNRSYLFAPGHNGKLLNRVFHAGADAVMLDLEDAVPPEAKALARAMVAAVLEDQPAWVRVNAARTDWCAADLAAVAGKAVGIRIPKVESPADVEWVTARAPGRPIICAIESARGVLAAQEIAAVPEVRFLAMGGVDLQRDLNTSGGNLQTLYVRSHLVLACRAAGIDPPIDSVYPLLADTAGLRDQAEFARSLGFHGKSVIHPRQLAVVHDVFTPAAADIEWAQSVLAGFETAGGGGFALPSGEFVDLPVADRARRLLEIAGQELEQDLTVGLGEPSGRRWRLLQRWVAIVAAGAAISGLFAFLNVPSPALFGGLVTGVLFALTSRWRTVLPGSVNSGAQAVVGVVLGGLLELSTLQSLGGDWLPVAAVIGGTLLLSVVAGLLMGRWTSVSSITGSLSLSAGGAAGVTSMSQELGADERMVAVVQYLRVVLIVATLPLVTTFVFQPLPGPQSGVGVPAGAGWVVDLTFTVACALVGSLLAVQIRMPAGTLLGPLILTATLTLAGWSFGAHPPAWLAQLAYGAIGLRIGLGFTKASLKLLRKVLPVALTLTVVIIVGCAGMGLFLASATGQSALAGYLATSPGGLFAVLSIAVETNTSATFVLAVQVLRIFVMLLVAPALAVFLARLREPT